MPPRGGGQGIAQRESGHCGLVVIETGLKPVVILPKPPKLQSPTVTTIPSFRTLIPRRTSSASLSPVLLGSRR